MGNKQCISITIKNLVIKKQLQETHQAQMLYEKFSSNKMNC